MEDADKDKSGNDGMGFESSLYFLPDDLIADFATESKPGNGNRTGTSPIPDSTSKVGNMAQLSSGFRASNFFHIVDTNDPIQKTSGDFIQPPSIDFLAPTRDISRDTDVGGGFSSPNYSDLRATAESYVPKNFSSSDQEIPPTVDGSKPLNKSYLQDETDWFGDALHGFGPSSSSAHTLVGMGANGKDKGNKVHGSQSLQSGYFNSQDSSVSSRGYNTGKGSRGKSSSTFQRNSGMPPESQGGRQRKHSNKGKKKPHTDRDRTNHESFKNQQGQGRSVGKQTYNQKARNNEKQHARHGQHGHGEDGFSHRNTRYTNGQYEGGPRARRPSRKNLKQDKVRDEKDHSLASISQEGVVRVLQKKKPDNKREWGSVTEILPRKEKSGSKKVSARSKGKVQNMNQVVKVLSKKSDTNTNTAKLQSMDVTHAVAKKKSTVRESADVHELTKEKAEKKVTTKAEQSQVTSKAELSVKPRRSHGVKEKLEPGDISKEPKASGKSQEDTNTIRKVQTKTKASEKTPLKQTKTKILEEAEPVAKDLKTIVKKSELVVKNYEHALSENDVLNVVIKDEKENTAEDETGPGRSVPVKITKTDITEHQQTKVNVLRTEEKETTPVSNKENDLNLKTKSTPPPKNDTTTCDHIEKHMSTEVKSKEKKSDCSSDVFKQNGTSVKMADTDQSNIAVDRKSEQKRKRSTSRQNKSKTNSPQTKSASGTKKTEKAKVIKKAEVKSVSEEKKESPDQREKSNRIKSPGSTAVIEKEENRVSTFVHSMVSKMGAFRSIHQTWSPKLSLSFSITDIFRALKWMIWSVFHIFRCACLFVFNVHFRTINTIVNDQFIALCYCTTYLFPHIATVSLFGTNSWVPVVSWYLFLYQMLCSGNDMGNSVFRFLLPVFFILEGFSTVSFFLRLNGAELLLVTFMILLIRAQIRINMFFLLFASVQTIFARLWGTRILLQWIMFLGQVNVLSSLSAISKYKRI